MTIVDDSVWLKVNEKEIGWKVLRGGDGGNMEGPEEPERSIGLL